MTDIILSTQNGEPVASSRQIAESFDKRHDHVIRDIDTIKKDVPNFGEMFFETEAPDSYGRPQRTYLMNRDGFTLLAMGFTGKAALEWKLKYIQAFNAMEKQLAQRPQLSRAELMAQALIAAHDELEHKDRQIAELTPKGIFADAVNASKKSILVGELAKLLCQNSVQIGQNRLFVWMREHGYLIRDPKRSDYNMPTQRAVEQGDHRGALRWAHQHQQDAQGDRQGSDLLCEPVFEAVKPRRGVRIQTYFGGYYEKTACESYIY